MANIKTPVLSFLAGTGLLVAGLSSAPFKEGLLAAGSSLASFGYSVLLLSWRRSPTPSQVSRPKGKPITIPSVSTAPPSSPEVPEKPPTSELKAVRSSSTEVPTPPPIPPPVAVSKIPGPPLQPSSTPIEKPPEVAQPPTMAMSPSSVTPPAAQKPKLERRLPAIKAPKLTLPPIVKAHLVPITLIGIGTPLIVGGLILAGLSPSVALGYGLLVPGVLLFAVGGLMLFLQLNRHPEPARRFCMHCGYPMLPSDAVCGRCGKAPPSGVDTKICPNCKEVLPVQALFCKNCGAGQPASDVEDILKKPTPV